MAAVIAIGISLILVGFRLNRKKSWQYAFSGFLGVVIAASFALIADNAANYYFPKIITSMGLVAISSISLAIKKPLAAWLSHLSRGWELEWFWRDDIRPAYTEVTLFWLALFTMRGILQFTLLINNNLSGLFLINTLLGFPVTIAVLILSYVYGIWRLKNLGGPGIDEYRSQTPKPWRGQTRGF